MRETVRLFSRPGWPAPPRPAKQRGHSGLLPLMRREHCAPPVMPLIPTVYTPSEIRLSHGPVPRRRPPRLFQRDGRYAAAALEEEGEEEEDDLLAECSATVSADVVHGVVTRRGGQETDPDFHPATCASLSAACLNHEGLEKLRRKNTSGARRVFDAPRNPRDDGSLRFRMFA
ncbi:hypothetical protein SKAU_G00408680 [Synaphobranchus kaupii]|uniref:Uncharacterized protein n=1 Tax=Synaphobranchus kaupii TaxID=118154 RepID=A0A9Q1EAH8_SYNKA|nr:hypothetical protein SKAU_G00408680 [Synaphobranchus kaupii]